MDLLELVKKEEIVESETLKETKNCPNVVRKKEVLYCIMLLILIDT
mgnify:CR=1 FL=1